MQQLLDFLPILIFTAVFFASDIYWATGALMASVTLQVAVYKLLGRPVGRELKFTFWASMAFGGLTLLLRDETFIQWKPTVVNGLLAASLIGSHFMRTNLIRKVLGGQLKLPDPVWVRLNFGWAAGFLFAGALNLVVAYNFSMAFWVTYKLVGGLGLTFSYVAVTLFYLHRLGLLAQETDAPAPGESATAAAELALDNGAGETNRGG
ncbi:MAG: septation protein IspZ [Gammaproteobacteria bacterium]|nr:septation protein IspZ [Gammaproteobacteria bacterium]